ncbi:MAG: S41 family peptidase [Bacteroidia bacterium]|nr:S41 family peptidase [Bacteroidia bacterium]MCF8427435.1 S41 family peptidase [Bacteroidia bacterium]
MSNNFNKWQPFIYALILSLGLMLGIFLRPATSIQTFMGGNNKFSELLSIINQSYVDTVEMDALEEQTINELLSNLDPHSVYIPASDLQVANEQLEGNFEGIGVEFNIINDTIMVVSAINGGPAQELGVLPGDRIIKVDTINVAGNGITSERVFKLLRGKGGSKVDVTVFRPSATKPIVFPIRRGTIPIFSVDAWRMLNRETGYIKISRFAENTHEEFLKAFDELKAENVKNLVLDLRGNPGGYLSTAIQLVDELLPDNKLIVYTQGRTKPRAEYRSERLGVFEEGKLIVLIDEGSASASEIVSGAIQDWDRGMVIGRRSFGKGLVQEPYELSDGSALRLTVSRYYTPSGRCIQKDYSDKDKYSHDILNRYENGELESDSRAIIFDSTIYHTLRLNRTVYAGGGILPDYQVPIDTTFNTYFLTNVVSNGLIGKFAYEYLDQNRKSITSIPSLKVYADAYQINETAYNQFVSFVVKNGLTPPTNQENERSSKFIKLQIKALVARQIWRDQGYYAVIQKEDRALQLAIKKIGENQALLSSGN